MQLSYAIGIADPVSIGLSTFGTKHVEDEKILEAIRKFFDPRPGAIIAKLSLTKPSFRYRDLCNYGCYGRPDLDLPWEKLDKVEELKTFLFGK